MAQLAWSFSLLRVTPEPLDTSFVFEDMAAFTAYLAGPTAYAGQIVAVKNATNVPDVYLIHEDRTYGGFGGGGGGGPGPQGPQGAAGAQGVQGVQGAEGAQGVQGPQGFQGVQGAGAEVNIRGSAANAAAIHALPGPHTIGDLWIAVDTGHGHVFNGGVGAAGWDDVGQIRGDTGPQGPQGFQGVQGAVGVQGTQGPQGDAGPQGAFGSQGTQGPMGVQGPPGTGIMGPQGPQGVQGFQGSQGPQGSGVQGVQGAQGAQGAQGVGTQGVQGSQGPPGITSIGGDLAGTPDAAIVWAIRGQQWGDMAPAFRQVPMWDGSRWVPTDLPTAPVTPGGVAWDGGAVTWDGGATTWS